MNRMEVGSLVRDDGSLLFSVDVSGNDTAALLYSSGTTSISKGVVLSHRNFIAAALMACSDMDLMGELSSVFLCILPMFHVFGLCVITYAQLQRGSTIVSMAKFDLELLLRTVERYKVTHMWVVPSIVLALEKYNGVGKFDLSSLKQIGYGAAPLGRELMQECAKNFRRLWLCRLSPGFCFADGLASLALLRQDVKNETGAGVFD